MFQKVVVSTDLSEDSGCLVRCAGELKALGVNVAVLTHVIDVFGGADVSSLAGESANAIFEQQVSDLEAQGMTVHVETPVGHPAFSLEEVRRKHEASLIVVGSRGAGVFDTPFSGSVSSDLMQLTETPLLVAAFAALQSEDGCGAACGRLLNHILYCTDFSEVADRAFRWVEGLASIGASTITLMHVQDKQRIEREASGMLSEYDRRDTVRLSKLRERAIMAGASDVMAEVVYGTPADRLAEASSSGRFSLIVLGTRGRSGRDAGMLGGVSDRVVRHSLAPILLIPEGAADVGH